MKKLITIALILFLLYLTAFSVFAKGMEGDFTGLFFQSGSDLTIDKKIDGTAFVSGNNITISSRIEGDLIVFGNIITLDGNINGNVYIFGNEVTVSKDIDKDIIVFGNKVKFLDKTRADRDAVIFAQTASIEGRFDRDVRVFAGNTNINASVGGSLSVRAENAEVGDNAEINGTMTYTADAADISDKAKIGEIIEKASDFKQKNENAFQGIVLNVLFSAVSTFFIGLFIVFLAPIYNKRSSYCLEAHPFRTFISGLLSIVCIFFLAIAAAITVVAVNISLILIILFVAALLLSFATTAVALTNLIISKAKIKNVHQGIWYFPIAAAAMRLLISIPYVGYLFITVTIITGFGLIMTFLFKNKESV